MDKAKTIGQIIVFVIALIIAAVLFVMCSSPSDSSSGRKWSDLSEIEKENARWAYDVQQGLKGK